MRILALADELPPEDPAELAAANGAEAVVCLGDLEASALAPLAGLGLPLLGVHGNHDQPGQLERLGIRDLHLDRAELAGFGFAGFEGCVRYKSGPFQYTQEEAAEMAARLPAAEVLLCHCPPRGVNDEPDDPAHAGFAALREWVERNPPRYLLHGHTTPDPRHRTRRVGQTEVIWVRGAKLVELEPRGPEGNR